MNQAFPVALRRFTTREYYTMLNAGVLRDDERVELIDGEIVAMPPISPSHASHVMRAHYLFHPPLEHQTLISIHNPLDLGDASQPQPDLMLLKPREDFYSHAHPTPGAVLLLLEVADATLTYDRTVKAPLYARSGVSEMWLVNLPDERIELYRDAGAKDYQTRQWIQRGETLSALAFPEMTFRAEDLLGQAPLL